jgi:hypothetical protein
MTRLTRFSIAYRIALRRRQLFPGDAVLSLFTLDLCRGLCAYPSIG